MDSDSKQFGKDLEGFVKELSTLLGKYNIPRGAVMITRGKHAALYPFAKNHQEFFDVIQICKIEVPKQAEKALRMYNLIAEEVKTEMTATRH